MVKIIDTQDTRAIKSEIQRIRAMCDRVLPRYQRNLARYCNVQDGRTALANLQDIEYPYNYYASDVDLYSTYNVVKSCTDTLTSKISQSKVRPFFNAVDGSFHTRKVCLNAQRFFDIYFDNQDIYAQSAIAVRDALLFGLGVMWIDDSSYRIRRIPPWWLYVDPYEYTEGIITRCYVRQPHYPRAALKKLLDTQDAKLDDYAHKVEVCTYYDLESKRKYIYVNGDCARVSDIPYDVPPFEIVYWLRPVKGFFAPAAADDIYPIQVRIDDLEQIIKDAYEKSVKHMLLVADKSNVKISSISNSPDTAVSYTATPTPYPPVQAFTPPPIDPAYERRLAELINRAYEFYGISQLSAQSKRPKGVTSALQIETMQDVESERYNVFLSECISLFPRIAKKCIDIFPPEAEIIDDPRIKGYTWADIQAARKLYQIQFSSAHVLSKDPSEKIKQIQELIAMGYIDQRTAANLLELPDVERAYNISNAAADYCETIIERALTTGDITGWSKVVDLDMLISMTATYIMRLDIVNAPKKEIEILTALLKTAMTEKDKAIKATAQTETPPPPAPPAGDMATVPPPDAMSAGQAP
jgi:hypothetical protein